MSDLLTGLWTWNTWLKHRIWCQIYSLASEHEIRGPYPRIWCQIYPQASEHEIPGLKSRIWCQIYPRASEHEIHGHKPRIWCQIYSFGKKKKNMKFLPGLKPRIWFHIYPLDSKHEISGLKPRIWFQTYTLASEHEMPGLKQSFPQVPMALDFTGYSGQKCWLFSLKLLHCIKFGHCSGLLKLLTSTVHFNENTAKPRISFWCQVYPITSEYEIHGLKPRIWGHMNVYSSGPEDSGSYSKNTVLTKIISRVQKHWWRTCESVFK